MTHEKEIEILVGALSFLYEDGPSLEKIQAFVDEAPQSIDVLTDIEESSVIRDHPEIIPNFKEALEKAIKEKLVDRAIADLIQKSFHPKNLVDIQTEKDVRQYVKGKIQSFLSNSELQNKMLLIRNWGGPSTEEELQTKMIEEICIQKGIMHPKPRRFVDILKSLGRKTSQKDVKSSKGQSKQDPDR